MNLLQAVSDASLIAVTATLTTCFCFLTILATIKLTQRILNHDRYKNTD